MDKRRTRGCEIVLAVLVLLAICERRASALLVSMAQNLVGKLDDAPLVCKLKVKEIKEAGLQRLEFFEFRKFQATCEVISILKGEAGKEIVVTYLQGFDPLPHLEAGKVYLVAMNEVPDQRTWQEVSEGEPSEKFGDGLRDRVLAELVQAAGATEKGLRMGAIGQIGMLRDARGAKAVASIVDDKDEDVAREAAIALYRMKVAPDAKRVMALFNPRVLEVWLEESGKPVNDANGRRVWLHATGRETHGYRTVRGVPGFDYATYVREGIKLDWVRKDERTLRLFFAVPGSAQRKQCVPELMKLLDHEDKRVRYWTVHALSRIVDDENPRTFLNEKFEVQWARYEAAEAGEIKSWKSWWKESGETYMKDQ